MGWADERMLAFDIETTGVDIESARIVTAAIALLGGGAETFKTSFIVNPGVPIPEEAAAVHGITDEIAARDGIPAGAAIAQIVGLIAGDILRYRVPIVAMNARFDLTILDREARRHAITPLIDRVGVLRVIDPYVIDKHLDRFRRGSRKLDALCAHYRADLDAAHDASSDAIAAARVAWRIGQTTKVGEYSLEELHMAQIGWADEQARSLADYFARKGTPQHVEGRWPIVPMPVAV